MYGSRINDSYKGIFNKSRWKKVLVAIDGKWMYPKKQFGEFQWYDISDTAPFT